VAGKSAATKRAEESNPSSPENELPETAYSPTRINRGGVTRPLYLLRIEFPMKYGVNKKTGTKSVLTSGKKRTKVKMQGKRGGK
jgi:hypothetical protein